MTLRLALASDHGGFALKQQLLAALAGTAALELIDLGTHDAAAIDYPIVAQQLCRAVLDGQAERGLLICGTGIGVSIMANRFPGIRAALCTDPFMARMAREHNDANVLCLGGRVIGPGLAEEIVRQFLSGTFAGGRHATRVALLGSP